MIYVIVIKVNNNLYTYNELAEVVKTHKERRT